MPVECKNIRILPEERCCGCAACFNSCPVNAIEMRENEDGFLYPYVKEGVCINCGKCVRACPELTPEFSNRKEPACYAAYAEDAVRMKSSSGGIFTLLAESVLEKGGCVCGVVMDEDFTAVHKIIHTKEELAGMRGSKYVQSRVGTAYREVKKLLEEGKQVLFCGVPCQVAGLKGFLSREYENLLTADVVCHGVPSPGVFRKYRMETYGDQLADFQFRTKEFGHNCNHCIATLKNGKRVVGNQENDAYERAFHTSLMLRSSCGECSFAPTPRQGDLTLGDFWHIGKYNPDFPDEKGISLVLLNSERGENVWKEIRPRLKFCEPVPVEFTLKHNRFRSKIRIPEGREKFFEENRTHTLKKAVELASGQKFSRKAAFKRWVKRTLPDGAIELAKKLKG